MKCPHGTRIKNRGKKENVKLQYVIPGAVLIVLALTLPILMATVIYSQKNIVAWAPTGTESEPTPLTPGTEQKDFGFVGDGYEDEVGKFSIVNVNGESYSESGTLVVVATLPGKAIFGYSMTGGWKVPTIEKDTMLKITFTYEASTGTVIDSVTAYGLIGGPNGYFTINGERADEDLVLYVASPDLNIKFYATEDGNLIDFVRIGVSKDGTFIETKGLTEVVSDTEWSTTYSLPGYGTYTITGQISYGGSWFRKMSLLMPWGVTDGDGNGNGDGAPVEVSRPILDITRLMLGLGGSALVVYGVMPTKRKRRLY